MHARPERHAKPASAPVSVASTPRKDVPSVTTFVAPALQRVRSLSGAPTPAKAPAAPARVEDGEDLAARVRRAMEDAEDIAKETPGALSPERRPPPPDAGPAPAVSSPRLANTASDVSMDELEGLVPPIRPLRHEFSDIGLDIQRILGEDAAASVARPKSSESRVARSEAGSEAPSPSQPRVVKRSASVRQSPASRSNASLRSSSSRQLMYGPGYTERLSLTGTERPASAATPGPAVASASARARTPGGSLHPESAVSSEASAAALGRPGDAAPGVRQERVRVAVRVRPALRQLREHTGAVEVLPDGCSVRVHRHLSLKSQIRFTDMSFDHILGPGAGQEDVYGVVAREVVEDVVRGYNGTVMAYGQTGAGKTFTVGNMVSTSGIIPRAASELFQIREQDVDHEYSFFMSYVQIYCEQIQDLLKPANDNLQLREDERGQVVLAGVQEVAVNNMQLLQVGERNRTYAFTRLNAQSSRSHAAVIITVEKRRARQDLASTDVRTMKVGKLYLVDLAGSERLKKSASEGQRQHEAKAINLSLTTLGMCINARASNNPNAYVPFRDSKLTRLLQESLGGNAKTSLVVCVPDAVEHIEETMSSLQFGQRAMAVLMRPRVNEVMDPDQFTAELEERISRAETAREMLKAALFSKQEQLEALRAAMESDHFTQRQKLRDVAVRFKEQKAALQAEQAKRAELESTCQRLQSQVGTLEASIAELQAFSSSLVKSNAELQGLNKFLHEQLDAFNRRAEEGSGTAVAAREDALRLATEGEDLRQELRRGEERVTSLQDQVGDLLEANRVLRGVNAELEAQVEEADRQADAAQDALRQSQAQAERQAQDIAQLKEMLNKWQEETAETHRKNRAARRIQKAWRRHRLRRLVAKINDSNRAAREKAGQLQEAQDRRRGVLLWVGAGVVTKSIESVSAAAEALCQMMLLPEKDLKRHLVMKQRSFTAFKADKDADVGPSSRAPDKRPGGYETPRRPPSPGPSGGGMAPGSVTGASQQGAPAAAGTSRLLKTRTPLKERLFGSWSRRDLRDSAGSASESVAGTPRSSRAPSLTHGGAQHMQPIPFAAPLSAAAYQRN